MENNMSGQKVVMLTEKPKAGDKKATMKMLMDEKKMYMVMEFDNSKAGTSCLGGDVDKCLVDQGFKKKGKEIVEGQPCQVFEKVETLKDGKTSQTTIWRPTSMKDVGFVKTIAKTEGNTIEFRVKNFKNAPLAASLFEVPAGYTKFEMPKGYSEMMQAQMQGKGDKAASNGQQIPNMEEIKKRMMKGMPGQ